MIDFADQIRDHVEYKEMELGLSLDVDGIVDTVRDELPQTIDEAFDLVDQLLDNASGRTRPEEDDDREDDFTFDDDGFFV